MVSANRERSSSDQRSFVDPDIIPTVISPSELNSVSEALMRGAPSRRSVARVLFVPASKRPRTRSAKWDASCSISLQEGIASLLSTVGEGVDPGVPGRRSAIGDRPSRKRRSLGGGFGVPNGARHTGHPDGAAMDLSEGLFADLVVLRLIGEGHSPGHEGDDVSLAMRPGAFACSSCMRPERHIRACR